MTLSDLNPYLQALLAAMLTVEWDELPTARDPEDGDAGERAGDEYTGRYARNAGDIQPDKSWGDWWR